MVADPMSDRGARPTDRAMSLLTKLSEELASASKANRQLVEHVVVGEIERIALRLGFARADDVVALRRQIDVLTAEVAALRAEVDEAAAKQTRAARKAPASRSSAGRAAGAKPVAATTVPSPTPNPARPATQRRTAKKAARQVSSETEAARADAPSGDDA